MQGELYNSEKFNFSARQLLKENKNYNTYQLEWQSATSTNEFVQKIFNDDLRLQEEDLYWELSKQFNPDMLHKQRVKEIFTDSVKTYADAGNVLVGNETFKIQIRNGRGDGDVLVSVFDKDMLKELEKRMVRHDVILNGEFNVYVDDCDMNDKSNRAVLSLTGRYAVFYYDGLIGLVDLE